LQTEKEHLIERMHAMLAEVTRLKEVEVSFNTLASTYRALELEMRLVNASNEK
jgi:hypothetical protein